MQIPTLWKTIKSSINSIVQMRIPYTSIFYFVERLWMSLSLLLNYWNLICTMHRSAYIWHQWDTSSFQSPINRSNTILALLSIKVTVNSLKTKQFKPHDKAHFTEFMKALYPFSKTSLICFPNSAFRICCTKHLSLHPIIPDIPLLWLLTQHLCKQSTHLAMYLISTIGNVLK